MFVQSHFQRNHRHHSSGGHINRSSSNTALAARAANCSPNAAAATNAVTSVAANLAACSAAGDHNNNSNHARSELSARQATTGVHRPLAPLSSVSSSSNLKAAAVASTGKRSPSSRPASTARGSNSRGETEFSVPAPVDSERHNQTTTTTTPDPISGGNHDSVSTGIDQQQQQRQTFTVGQYPRTESGRASLVEPEPHIIAFGSAGACHNHSIVPKVATVVTNTRPRGQLRRSENSIGAGSGSFVSQRRCQSESLELLYYPPVEAVQPQLQLESQSRAQQQQQQQQRPIGHSSRQVTCYAGQLPVVAADTPATSSRNSLELSDCDCAAAAERTSELAAISGPRFREELEFQLDRWARVSAGATTIDESSFASAQHQSAPLFCEWCAQSALGDPPIPRGSSKSVHHKVTSASGINSAAPTATLIRPLQSAQKPRRQQLQPAATLRGCSLLRLLLWAPLLVCRSLSCILPLALGAESSSQTEQQQPQDEPTSSSSSAAARRNRLELSVSSRRHLRLVSAFCVNFVAYQLETWLLLAGAGTTTATTTATATTTTTAAPTGTICSSSAANSCTARKHRTSRSLQQPFQHRGSYAGLSSCSSQFGYETSQQLSFSNKLVQNRLAEASEPVAERACYNQRQYLNQQQQQYRTSLAASDVDDESQAGPSGQLTTMMTTTMMYPAGQQFYGQHSVGGQSAAQAAAAATTTTTTSSHGENCLSRFHRYRREFGRQNPASLSKQFQWQGSLLDDIQDSAVDDSVNQTSHQIGYFLATCQQPLQHQHQHQHYHQHQHQHHTQHQHQHHHQQQHQHQQNNSNNFRRHRSSTAGAALGSQLRRPIYWPTTIASNATAQAPAQPAPNSPGQWQQLGARRRLQSQSVVLTSQAPNSIGSSGLLAGAGAAVAAAAQFHPVSPLAGGSLPTSTLAQANKIWHWDSNSESFDFSLGEPHSMPSIGGDSSGAIPATKGCALPNRLGQQQQQLRSAGLERYDIDDDDDNSEPLLLRGQTQLVEPPHSTNQKQQRIERSREYDEHKCGQVQWSSESQAQQLLASISRPGRKPLTVGSDSELYSRYRQPPIVIFPFQGAPVASKFETNSTSLAKAAATKQAYRYYGHANSAELLENYVRRRHQHHQATATSASASASIEGHDRRQHQRLARAATQLATTAGNRLAVRSDAEQEHQAGADGNGANKLLTTPSSSTHSAKKGASPGKLSLAGARRRLGFKKKGLSSLSVQRSEEIVPLDAGHLVRQMTANSLTDSGNESGSYWLSQSQTAYSSPDPRACFVEGLGAGQIASRQALVSPYLGDIQLSLSDRRGMLEVEVVRARQLQAKPEAKTLPSPYVKVYLMKNKKCVAKFRTSTARRTLDPLYQQLFTFRDDYADCVLQAIVWGDYGKRDKKSLMGIVQIHLSDLDISNVAIGWYKLFNAPSMASSVASSKALRQTILASKSVE